LGQTRNRSGVSSNP